MRGFSVENQSTGTYLVCEIGDGEQIDRTSLGMMTNNNIPGLAPAVFMQIDEKRFIKYNVSGKVPVSQLFSGPVNRKRLISIFQGIVDAILSMDDYMLNVHNLVLDIDYIYTNMVTCETVMVCLPVEGEPGGNMDICAFFKNIIFTTQFDQTENCDHVAQILNYLNRAADQSMVEFKGVLSELEGGAQVVSSKPVMSGDKNVGNGQPSERIQNTRTEPQAPVTQIREQPKVQQPPVQVPAASPEKTAQAESAAQEKPMSRLYLLQHYSKENAAIFKAQQQAKKQKDSSKKNEEAPGKGPVKKRTASEQPKAEQRNVPTKNMPVRREVPPKGMVRGQAMPDISRNANIPANEPINTQVGAEVTRKEEPCRFGLGQNDVKTEMGMNFGETVVLSAETAAGTTLLETPQNGMVMNAYLIRMKNGEKIVLNGDAKFVIGREPTYADYVIAGNKNVSRSHAALICRNGVFYVKDTYSKNGTFVDGQRCPAEKEITLRSGTKIKFADEEFEFKMY